MERMQEETTFLEGNGLQELQIKDEKSEGTVEGETRRILAAELAMEAVTKEAAELVSKGFRRSLLPYSSSPIRARDAIAPSCFHALPCRK